MAAIDEHIYHMLRHHINSTWPANEKERFVWKSGPIQKSLPRFGVLRIKPNGPTDPWVYVSLGAWEATKEGPWGLEFMILSPSANAIHVETLAMVANFHADPRYRINVGSIMNIGREWMPDATSSHLLVSLPYVHGPQLEVCRLHDRAIRFLWLVPITPEEVAFLRTHGQEALEQKLETAAVDVIDPQRKSVV